MTPSQKTAAFAAFRALLIEAEAIFDGVQRRVAAALEIDATRYNKLRTGTAYTLNTENLLRLAALLKRPPTEVLRAAGKHTLADQLDAYYGETHYEPLPGGRQAAQLATEWVRLTEDQRELVLRVMAGLPTLDAAPHGATKAPRHKPSRAR